MSYCAESEDYAGMLAMGGDHILYRAEIHAIANWGEAMKAGADTLPDRRAAKIFRSILEDGRAIEFVGKWEGYRSQRFFSRRRPL